MARKAALTAADALAPNETTESQRLISLREERDYLSQFTSVEKVRMRINEINIAIAAITRMHR
jgi:hypothetical protein